MIVLLKNFAVLFVHIVHIMWNFFFASFFPFQCMFMIEEAAIKKECVALNGLMDTILVTLHQYVSVPGHCVLWYAKSACVCVCVYACTHVW